jgi:hypothetical protein
VIGVVLGVVAAAGAAVLSSCAVLRVGRQFDAWCEELREEVRQSQGERERALVIDERLADFERRLQTDSHWPTGAMGVAAAGGLAAVVAALSSAGANDALLALAFTVIGVMAARFGAKAQRQRQGAMRRAADRVVAELAPELLDRELALPRRRAPRFKRGFARRDGR